MDSNMLSIALLSFDFFFIHFCGCCGLRIRVHRSQIYEADYASLTGFDNFVHEKKKENHSFCLPSKPDFKLSGVRCLKYLFNDKNIINHIINTLTSV